MKCENCGQTLLADDTACWQCGYPVGGEQSPPLEAPQLREKWQQETGEEAKVRPVIVYSVVTVVVVCLALAVTLYLGRQPLVQAAVQLPPEGWDFISNIQRTFTTAVPESWTLFDIDDTDAVADEFDTLLSDHPILTEATAPLGTAVEDTYVIYGSGPVDETGDLETEGFLVVARSNLLNDMTPDALLALATESDMDVNNGEYVENFDKSHLSLDVDIPDGEETLRCRQQIIPGVAYTMIVSVCGRDHNELARVLDLFQRLD